MFDGLHALNRGGSVWSGSDDHIVPAVTDPIAILYSLEERLATCEDMVQEQLLRVQHRLENLEREVDSLKGGQTQDVGSLERKVMTLAERLLRIEEDAG